MKKSTLHLMLTAGLLLTTAIRPARAGDAAGPVRANSVPATLAAWGTRPATLTAVPLPEPVPAAIAAPAAGSATPAAAAPATPATAEAAAAPALAVVSVAPARARTSETPWHKDCRVWSTLSLLAAHSFDAASSGGGVEANPVLGGGSRYGWHGTALKFSFTGGFVVLQSLFLKKYPESKRAWCAANYAGAAAVGATAVRNLSAPK